MSRRKKWILGGLGVVVAVLAIAAFQFETRYETREGDQSARLGVQRTG